MALAPRRSCFASLPARYRSFCSFHFLYFCSFLKTNRHVCTLRMMRLKSTRRFRYRDAPSPYIARRAAAVSKRVCQAGTPTSLAEGGCPQSRLQRCRRCLSSPPSHNGHRRCQVSRNAWSRTWTPSTVPVTISKSIAPSAKTSASAAMAGSSSSRQASVSGAAYRKSPGGKM